jgi:hypothetical protein
MFRLCYTILRLCMTVQDQKVQLKHVTRHRSFSLSHCYVRTLRSNDEASILKKSLAKMSCPTMSYSFPVAVWRLVLYIPLLHSYTPTHSFTPFYYKCPCHCTPFFFKFALIRVWFNSPCLFYLHLSKYFLREYHFYLRPLFRNTNWAQNKDWMYTAWGWLNKAETRSWLWILISRCFVGFLRMAI